MQSSRAPVNPWSYYPTSMDAIACFLPWSLPAVNSWCRSALNTAFLSFILSPFLLSVCLFSLEMPTHLWLQLLAHQQPPCLGDCWGPGSSQFLESAQMATLRTFPGSYLKLPLPSQLPQHFLSCVPFIAFVTPYHITYWFICFLSVFPLTISSRRVGNFTCVVTFSASRTMLGV